MPDRKIYRFRFTTDGGEAYAVAVLDDEMPPFMWRVGFAFRSPRDGRKMIPGTISVNGNKVKKKFDLGYQIAENRARKYRDGTATSFPMACGEVSDRRHLMVEITKHFLRALPPYTEHALSPSSAFRIRPYRGLKKGDFREWLFGKFADQFRARYAGGV